MLLIQKEFNSAVDFLDTNLWVVRLQYDIGTIYFKARVIDVGFWAIF